MSKWTDYLNQYYKDKKSSNPKYTFTQAMKDASKSYKKSKTIKTTSSVSSEDECMKKCMKKGGSKKNRSKKSRKVSGGTVVVPTDANASHIAPNGGSVVPHSSATGVATTAASV